MPIPIDRERLEELRKDHGIYTARDVAKSEAREQHLRALRDTIDDLTPDDVDFYVLLRTVLRGVIDALEED